ncbi:MAG: efflux RND transporter permease subunit [Pseudomonadota bacterium]
MALRISSWAIRHPIPPIVFFVVLCILGVAAYLKLPINNMPNIAIPIVQVTVVQPGSAPAEIETQITRRIEGSVAGLGNIKRITSSVGGGISATVIEFRLGIDINRAVTDVRDAVNKTRPLLPKGIEEPVIQRIDVEGGPILTYTVAAPAMVAQELSWFVDDVVTRHLLAISGVAKVQRQGGVGREIRVQLNPDRLLSYGITPNQVNAQLRALNINLPGGRTELGYREQSIRTLGSAPTVTELANITITLPNGRFVRLADLAHVYDAASEPRQMARLNDQPVIAFALYRSKTSSEVSVEQAVEVKLAELKRNHPGIEFTQVLSLVEFTKTSYQSALWAFVEGTLLAIVVVFFFLRDWRATWISGIAIPLSVIPTFIVMQWLGFTLNGVSLLALSLVAGVLVDDAIVETENIVRHMRMGKRPFEAALDAADEIGLAVVATTAVIVAVFIPVSFMEGVVGQYFIQFGLTVALAALFSLLVARLITPLLAAYFLKGTSINPLKPRWRRWKYAQNAGPGSGRLRVNSAFSRISALPSLLDRIHRGTLKPDVPRETLPAWLTWYGDLLSRALDHRKLVLLGGGAILAGSFALAPLLASGFLPPEDKSLSILRLDLPPGSTLRDTDETVRDITALVRARQEVGSVFAVIGDAGDGEVRQAAITIRLVPPDRRLLGVKAFESAIRDDLSRVPNVRMSFLADSGAKEISIVLTSGDPVLLEKTARALEFEMRGLKDLSNITSNLSLPRPELRIQPRLDEMARLGVTVEQIADTVRVATVGDLNVNLAKFNAGNRQVPIRVLVDPEIKKDAGMIANLRVLGRDDRAVPLGAVADIEFGSGPASINRYDNQRQVTLEANLNGVALGDALDAINSLPTLKALPEGVSRHEVGDAEFFSEMFTSFATAMALGILLVFAVLVLLFGNVIQPVTIMVALPLSVGGALLGLLMTGTPLSLPAVIGILMLMGIVGKNSILLIDFVIEKRREGMPRRRALIEAGTQRARPIIMTTIAMIAGMLPIAIGFGIETAFRAPMAIAVIGGLITSTLLSLIFVPIVYTFLDDFEAWIKPRLLRLTTYRPVSRPEKSHES